MLESAPPRFVPVVLAGMALFVSCTTVTDDTPEVPGAGPIIERLETDEPQSIYGMVATANLDSSKIAVEILEAGGNAIDAAVAAAFAVGVSDPGDSGLGGTTYMLIRFADGRATAIDGSALVPLMVDRNRLTKTQEAGNGYGMELAAVPATLAALDYAASKYGTLPLSDLIEPSIELAKRGYYPVPFQEISIKSYLEELLESDFLKYFVLENGAIPPSTKTLQRRPVLASTLQRIANRGSNDFYRGTIAAEIVADMADRGGFVSQDDLAILRAREVAPLRGTYRDTEILAFPHPSMGGAVIQALNILEQYPPAFLDQDTVGRYQVFAEAFHIATVDHSRFLSDTIYFGANGREALLTKGHAAERMELIEPGQAHHQVDRELDAGLHDVVEGSGGGLRIHPLANLLQSHGITGLEPRVDAGDAGASDPLPLVAAFLHQELRRAVHGDALEVREALPGGVTDDDQVVGGQRRRVAVGEEDSPHLRTVGLERHVQVFYNLLNQPPPELLVAVHGAERTPVVGTADGRLDDQGPGFGRRPVHRALVSHGKILSRNRIGLTQSAVSPYRFRSDEIATLINKERTSVTEWLKLGLSLEQGDSAFRNHLDTLDNAISAADDNNATMRNVAP